jgi:hypothetical protein
MPAPDKLSKFMTGAGSSFNFYEMFSGSGAGTNGASKGGKPFMISETGVSIHIQQVDRNGIWTLLPNTDAPADRETGSLWSFRS